MNEDDQEPPLFEPAEIDPSPEVAADQLPPERRLEIFAAQIESYRGSFPHPDILRKLDEVVPGAAAMAFEMARQQSDHRQSIERLVVESNVQSQRRGSLYGFVLAVVGLGVAGILAWRGEPGWAVSVVIAEVVGLASVFVVARIKQGDERSEKSREMKDTTAGDAPDEA